MSKRIENLELNLESENKKDYKLMQKRFEIDY